MTFPPSVRLRLYSFGGTRYWNPVNVRGTKFVSSLDKPFLRKETQSRSLTIYFSLSVKLLSVPSPVFRIMCAAPVLVYKREIWVPSVMSVFQVSLGPQSWLFGPTFLNGHVGKNDTGSCDLQTTQTLAEKGSIPNLPVTVITWGTERKKTVVIGSRGGERRGKGSSV